MTGSSTAASREGDRRKAPMQLENGRGEMAVPRDRRTLGQTNTLLERGVDLERLREDRLRKVQTEMRPATWAWVRPGSVWIAWTTTVSRRSRNWGFDSRMPTIR